MSFASLLPTAPGSGGDTEQSGSVDSGEGSTMQFATCRGLGSVMRCGRGSGDGGGGGGQAGVMRGAPTVLTSC